MLEAAHEQARAQGAELRLLVIYGSTVELRRVDEVTMTKVAAIRLAGLPGSTHVVPFGSTTLARIAASGS